MTTLTITINGNKPGEKIFFILSIEKSNFLKVVEMEWETVEDVLEGERNGFYTISK